MSPFGLDDPPPTTFCISQRRFDLLLRMSAAGHVASEVLWAFRDAGSPSCLNAAPLRPQQGEEDHVADAAAVCQQHDEPVDADAQAAGRGHADLEGLDEVCVH